MVVDHFYFCTGDPDEIVNILIDFGLKEGKSNTHPGQGTANRRFFFQNSMLELLYVNDRSELESDRTNVLGLAEQFDNPLKSTLGIIFRPGESENKRCPFEAVPYRPLYLPENLHMDVVCNTGDLEPKFIYMDFATKPIGREEIFHEIENIKYKCITKITLKVNIAELSNVEMIVKNNSDLNIEKSLEDILEIELDDNSQGKVRDFTPFIPLRIK